MLLSTGGAWRPAADGPDHGQVTLYRRAAGPAICRQVTPRPDWAALPSLMAQCLDRVQPGRANRRVKTEKKAAGDADADSGGEGTGLDEHDQWEIRGRKALDDFCQAVADGDPYKAANECQHERFDQELKKYVVVVCADGFAQTDFSCALGDAVPASPTVEDAYLWLIRSSNT